MIDASLLLEVKMLSSLVSPPPSSSPPSVARSSPSPPSSIATVFGSNVLHLSIMTFLPPFDWYVPQLSSNHNIHKSLSPSQ
jgi:hypothetical protein